MTKTRLSVNINKVALIRNSRGEGVPDLIAFAKDCEAYGAQGITVHPRPDERHVRYDDIPRLKEVVTTELNIEGNPDKRFIDMVLREKPDQCTLVPDDPDALTSDEGWDTIRHQSFLQDIVAALKEEGIRVSIFVNADLDMVEGAAQTGADRIELYTGPYANDYLVNPNNAVAPYIEAANRAHELTLGLNAGHDFNLDNLAFFIEQVADVDEVSIGHALISDALYYGIENTIQKYRQCIDEGWNNKK